jgi:glucokinase
MAHERLCTCGKWDCWETYASGTGLAETARRLLEAAPNAEYSKLVASKPGGIPAVTTHDVVNAWRSGNALALEMMDTWHTHIAVGLGSLINILDPARVVVGGGMAQFVDFKLLTERTMPRTMYPANLPSDIAPLAIVPAELGNQAGLVGAACLARLVP